MMVLAIGWAVYKHFWGPRGRVTASVSTASAMALFKASLVEPDLAAVQANNDLMLIRLSSKEKIWSLNLASLEKKYVPPKAMDEAARQSIDAEAIAQFRDPLRFVEAAGGSLLLHSDRQLMVVDAKTGNVKWEFFSPDVSIDHAQLHSAGVLCKLREFSTDFRRRNLRLVNFALDNGAETWSVSEGLTYGDNLVISHNQAAWLSRQPSPAPARGTLTAAPEAMREAMEQFGFDADEEWNYADDARAAATKFDLNVVSLADGKSVATQTFALVGFAALEHVGEYLCVRSRDRLVMLKSGAEPIWEKPLDAKPQRLASGGAVLAVATEKNLVAYDIATGRERWSRAGLEIEQLAVGADGAVFATVRVSSEEAKQGEAAKYRLTGFPGAGMTDPRAPVTVLLKLDPDSGKTLWGVRDVGRDLKITPEGIYAFDHVTQLNLLASQGPFVGYYSVRCLKPQNGKEAWAYEGRGDLYHHELAGKKVFLVTAKDPPEGRANPRCNYDLQTVERR
jgi:outer membrane protein assembly factor BamB